MMLSPAVRSSRSRCSRHGAWSLTVAFAAVVAAKPLPAQFLRVLAEAARGDARLAYDSRRDRLVMAENRLRLWEFDGRYWGAVPFQSPLTLQAMAFDPARGWTWIVAQDGASSRLFTYDGRALTDVGPGPAATCTALMPRASALPRAFGNLNGAGRIEDWDGAQWQLAPMSVEPNWLAAHDRNRDVTVLAGTSPTVGTGTFEWNGQGLGQRSPTVPRGDRGAFDAVRGQVVAIGTDVQAWNGVAWTDVTGGANGRGTRAMVAVAVDDRRGDYFGVLDSVSQRPTDLLHFHGAGWSTLATALHVDTGAIRYDALRHRPLRYDSATSRLSAWDDGWTAIDAPGGPPVGGAHLVEFDAARGQLVVLHTPNLSRVATTWLWNGAWQQSPAASPPGRLQASSTWDSGRQRVLVVGGIDPSSFIPLSDHWEWDGAAWQRFGGTVPAVPPFAPLGHDPRRQRTLLQTGDAMWSFDGQQWTQVASGLQFSPSSRLAFDGSRGNLVGVSSALGLHEWNGSTWLPLVADVTGEPFAIDGRAAVYVYSRDRMVAWVGTTPAMFDFGACTHVDLAPFAVPRVGSGGFQLDVTASGAGPCLLLLGAQTSAANPGADCPLLVQPAAALLALIPATGVLHQGLPIPARARLVGTAIAAQAVVLDATVPAGFAASRGLRLVVGE